MPWASRREWRRDGIRHSAIDTVCIGKPCDAILSVVLAPSCAACGERSIIRLRRPGLRGLLGVDPPAHAAALRSLRRSAADVARDQHPLARCPRCRRATRVVDRARAIGAYDGALRAIVHALKYEGGDRWPRPLGGADARRAAPTCSRGRRARPGSPAPSRRRQRGFNQAADLARHLGHAGRRRR